MRYRASSNQDDTATVIGIYSVPRACRRWTACGPALVDVGYWWSGGKEGCPLAARRWDQGQAVCGQKGSVERDRFALVKATPEVAL